MTAPIAPAPAAPVAAPEAPRPSLSDAIASVRAGAVPAPVAPTGAILDGSGTPPQPRDEAGRFAALDAQVAGDGTVVVEGEPVAEGAPAPEPTTEESDFVPFVLAGLTERGEEDVVLEFPNDPVVQERLKRLQNDGMRRKDYDEQMRVVTQQAQQAEAVMTQAQIDPAGFTNEYLPPEAKRALALSWLCDPDFLEMVRDDVAVLDSPQERRRVAAEAQLALADASRQVQTTLQQRQQNRATTEQITIALSAIVPDTLNAAQKDVWMADRYREIATMLQSGQLHKSQLNAFALPSVLGPTLQAWGIQNPTQRIAAALEQRATPFASAPAAPGAVGSGGGRETRGAAMAAPSPTIPAAPRVDQVRAAQAARTAAAQTGGPGSGAPLSEAPAVAPGPDQMGRTMKALRAQLRAG